MNRSPIRRERSRSPIRRDDRRRPRDKRPIDPHSQSMIYLSNLPFELKWNDLKDLLRQKCGESAYVEFLEDSSGKPKGCAVLDFDNRAAADRCVETFHRLEIGGRHITAKEIRDPQGFFRHLKNNEGIDFLANRALIPGRTGFRQRRERDEDTASDNETYGLSPTFLQQLNIKPPLVNRVFVTNIPYNCGVGKLFDIFSLAGKITWFDLQLDNEGKTKGMAIIQYSHPIEAVQAISMLNNQRLFDRTLSVKMDRFEKEIERQPGELPSGLRAIGMGLGSGGAPLANVASILSSLATVNNAAMAVQQQPIVQPFIQQPVNGNPSFANQSFPQASFPAANPSLNGSFGNNGTDMSQLGFNSAQSQSQQMFKPEPVQQQMFKPEPVQQMYKQEPQAMFKVDPQQSQQQQPSASYGNQNNGFFNNNATQPVNNGPPPINTPGFPSSSNVYAKMSPQINNYGQPSQQQNKPYYDSQPSRVILIKNLPMDYTWQIVHDRVQKFGEVENVEIISPGVAKVRYVRVSDAEKLRGALSGSTVEGRIIAIEYL